MTKISADQMTNTVAGYSAPETLKLMCIHFRERSASDIYFNNKALTTLKMRKTKETTCCRITYLLGSM